MAAHFTTAATAESGSKLARAPAAAPMRNSAVKSIRFGSIDANKAARGVRLMRRTGHIRERSPGSFEIRYTLATDPATGKRKVATTTIRGARKDAEKELRRLLRS